MELICLKDALNCSTFGSVSYNEDKENSLFLKILFTVPSSSITIILIYYLFSEPLDLFSASKLRNLLLKLYV